MSAVLKAKGRESIQEDKVFVFFQPHSLALPVQDGERDCHFANQHDESREVMEGENTEESHYYNDQP